MFNVDRWTVYTLQKLGVRRSNKSWAGEHLPVTPAQSRRMKKKMRSHNDQSLGIM